MSNQWWVSGVSVSSSKPSSEVFVKQSQFLIMEDMRQFLNSGTAAEEYVLHHKERFSVTQIWGFYWFVVCNYRSKVEAEARMLLSNTPPSFVMYETYLSPWLFGIHVWHSAEDKTEFLAMMFRLKAVEFIQDVKESYSLWRPDDPQGKEWLDVCAGMVLRGLHQHDYLGVVLKWLKEDFFQTLAFKAVAFTNNTFCPEQGVRLCCTQLLWPLKGMEISDKIVLTVRLWVCCVRTWISDFSLFTLWEWIKVEWGRLFPGCNFMQKANFDCIWNTIIPGAHSWESMTCVLGRQDIIQRWLRTRT